MTQISDIMKSHVATVGPDDTMRQALDTMLWSGGRHLPVVEGDKLLGILSERDILRHRGHDRDLDDPVRSAMSVPVHSAAPTDSIREVSLRMASERIGCMPVVHHGRLEGLVTAVDVLAHEGRMMTTLPVCPHHAADIMTPDPITVHADDAVNIAIDRMATRNVRHLPVIDGDGRLAGMLEDRAIHLGRERDAEQLRVASFMDPDPYSVESDAPYELLTGLFADSRLSAVAVVDAQQKVCGIISYVDVLRHSASERPAAP